jgi:ABC-type multidrug transport system ATPase subunit
MLHSFPTRRSSDLDRVIVVGQGRLIAEGTVADVVGRSSSGHVRVDSADPERLGRLSMRPAP